MLGYASGALIVIWRHAGSACWACLWRDFCHSAVLTLYPATAAFSDQKKKITEWLMF